MLYIIVVLLRRAVPPDTRVCSPSSEAVHMFLLWNMSSLMCVQSVIHSYTWRNYRLTIAYATSQYWKPGFINYYLLNIVFIHF